MQRVVKQRGLSASGRPTPGKLLPVVSSISTEQHLASADSLYRDEFEKRQRILVRTRFRRYMNVVCFCDFLEELITHAQLACRSGRFLTVLKFDFISRAIFFAFVCVQDKAAQAEYEAKLRASRPKWNKLSAEYLRRGLARELCAFVVAAVGKHPAKSVELTDMLDPNSPNVWSRQFLCFDEVADACITLGFVSVRACMHNYA